MLELYLTRHGETTENAAKILQGQTPGHLNNTGIQQAQQLRDQLSEISFDAMVSSDLLRTMKTAQIINESHHLQIIPCTLLRERDWGEFTGMKVTDIRVSPKDFPASIENSKQLAQRAQQFILWILDHFEDGKRILAVGHGYFDRCIVAYLQNKTAHDVPVWGNAEVRILQIDRNSLPITIINGVDIISAN